MSNLDKALEEVERLAANLQREFSEGRAESPKKASSATPYALKIQREAWEASKADRQQRARSGL